jgi:hypothetical protein
LAEILVQVGLIESNLPGLGGSKTAQSVQECGFPGAARAKDPDELARFRQERGAIQDRTIVALPGEPYGDDPADRNAADADESSSIIDKEKWAKLDRVANHQIVFVKTATVYERS